MSAGETLYTARFAGPELIERGRTNTLSCSVYRNGALVAVTQAGSTVTLCRPDGTALVNAGAVVVASSVATYSLTAAAMASETYGEDWTLEWALVLPDGVTHTFRRMAAMCRRSLYPVITDADLLRRHSDLTALLGNAASSYQSYIDEAWVETVHQLRQVGNLTQLISSPEELRYVLLYATLEGIFRDYAVSAAADAKWADLAKHYAERRKDAWGSLSLRYDSAETGTPDADARPATSVTFLGASTADPWGSAWR